MAVVARAPRERDLHPSVGALAQEKRALDGRLYVDRHAEVIERAVIGSCGSGSGGATATHPEMAKQHKDGQLAPTSLLAHLGIMSADCRYITRHPSVR